MLARSGPTPEGRRCCWRCPHARGTTAAIDLVLTTYHRVVFRRFRIKLAARKSERDTDHPQTKAERQQQEHDPRLMTRLGDVEDRRWNFDERKQDRR